MTDSRSDSEADSAGGASGNGGPARDHFEDGTFNDWLDLAIEDYREGEVVLSVECEGAKRNTSGILHGGVTASLIDVAGGIAIASTFADAPPSMATTSLDVDYLRPVTEMAYATAEALRVGDATALARVEVESEAPDGERKLVAIGKSTYERH